ncbi:MAG: 50S ribosomal protein L17, partial [Candidatus Zambryskibacteria bacterium]|nr:50S ribosomal protein L17 [Candidatus Zambryskibacteria bacterium]
KFGRVKKVRDTLLQSLALSLIINERIKTTDAKARELRPMVEKMVTLGRLGTIASRRSLVSKIGVIGAEKIVKDLAPKYKGRSGGYTRITKLPARLSDGSLMAVIEFV